MCRQKLRQLSHKRQLEKRVYEMRRAAGFTASCAAYHHPQCRAIRSRCVCECHPSAAGVDAVFERIGGRGAPRIVELRIPLSPASPLSWETPVEE
jgi:hypothetical protein